MKRLLLIGLLVGLATLAQAKRDCPVLLARGTATQGGIRVTARNTGHFAIYRLEFHCAVRGAAKNEPPMRCNANTPLFFPDTNFTAEFYYPSKPRPVTLTVKSLALSDGSYWKPRYKDSCQTLTIAPPRSAAKKR